MSFISPTDNTDFEEHGISTASYTQSPGGVLLPPRPPFVMFRDDWYTSDGRPRAVPHLNTQNTTFKHLAVVFKRLGVQNNLFHLALHDPDLANYDPHNLKDPSRELRLRILREAQDNIWYYLREVVRIPAQGGDPIRFEANRGNIAMTWCYYNNIDYMSVMPRQTGKEQPIDSLIKAPTGWIRMGDIKTGDYVTAHDGTAVKVVGVYPQGIKDSYEISFSDGRSTRCGLEHLWAITSDLLRGTNVVTLKDVMTHMEFGDVYIPLMQPEIKDNISLPSNPYDAPHALTTTDVMSDVYLTASHAQRLELFRGIANRFGNTRSDGSIIFDIPNSAFREQIQHLTRSLGGVSKSYGTTALVSQLRAENRLKVESIKYAGREVMQCIEIDHPDHLYITDDFIVTHNTIGAIAITSHVIYFHGRNIKMSMLTKDTKLLQENVSRLKEIRETLPKYLIAMSKDDTDNKEGLSYTIGDARNEYKTYVGQKDKQAADNTGRGMSTPTAHLDETGFIPNIKITFPVMMAATTAAAKNAARNGQPHSNLYTTTAARTDTESGRFAFKLLNDAMVFTEKLYDCKDNAAAKQMVKMNSTNNIVNGTFSYLQLGKTHQWLADVIAKVQATDEEVARDFLNIWRAGSETGILSPEIIGRMKANQQEPLFVEVVNDYTVSWYVSENTIRSEAFRRKVFIAGMDSSEQIGRDFTTLVIIDPKELKVIATFRCNESSITKLGLFVGNLLVAWPKMLFIPERKSTGLAIIDTICLVLQQHGINPFTRIYNKLVQEKDNREFSDLNIHSPNVYNDDGYRKHLGFITTGKSREFLYKTTLNRAAKLNSDRIYDRTLIDEFATLSSINGRIDHSHGKHDDMVIAYLLACWLVFEGRNLSYYGIDVNHDFIGSITDTGVVMDAAQREHQLYIRKQLAHLKAMEKSAQNELMKRAYQAKIMNISALIDDNIALEPVSREQVELTLNEIGNVYGNKLAVMTPPPAQSFSAQDVTRLLRAL